MIRISQHRRDVARNVSTIHRTHIPFLEIIRQSIIFAKILLIIKYNTNYGYTYCTNTGAARTSGD